MKLSPLIWLRRLNGARFRAALLLLLIHPEFGCRASAPAPREVSAEQANAAGRLTDDQRAVHGWSNMIKYYTDRGDAKAVANAGAAMLMHSKRVSQQAGAFALAAIEKGDYRSAAKAIQVAYNTFPDGQTVRVNTAGPGGIKYEVVGDKGVGKDGKITPEELKDLATGMLNGTQWFQHAAQLAQVPGQGETLPTAPKPSLPRMRILSCELENAEIACLEM